MKVPNCIIDSQVLNEKTLGEMNNIALSFFASACGRNRGAFVLDPPNGETYSCLQLPQDFAELSGVSLTENTTIVNSNDIQHQYEDGNITASDTLHMLNFLINRVYHSTPDVEKSPYSCEINGLAKLKCEGSSKPNLLRDNTPLRAVNLAGVLVSAPWATGGRDLSLTEAKDFYSLEDFVAMAELGLNSVQLSVPTAAFDGANEHGIKVMLVLNGILENVKTAGLQAIINLVTTGDELDAITAAGEYCSKNQSILAMILPKETRLDTNTMILAIRAKAPVLPLFLPVNQGDLPTINGDIDDYLYGALQMPHTTSIGDVASSTSADDRSKLFYHEATSCITRSPIEYSECYSNLPLFLASGFDLSIDDCIYADEKSFKDYGQCDRFNETMTSGFWHRHRASLAARQLFAYEQGMGWSFATWKIYNNENVGTLDHPAKLFALEDVVAAGLFPKLVSDDISAKDACLNPPEPDFVLGDDTVAPTQGPPPDCGDGWWNYTSEQCDFWVPPTLAPTQSCPTCPEVNATKAAVSGALVGGLVVGAIVFKLFGNTRNDYSAIPN